MTGPTLILLVSVLAGPEVELSVGAGGATNPYELPAESADVRPQPGVFVPVDARLRWKSAPDRFLRAGLDARLEAELFAYVRPDPRSVAPTRPRDAGEWTADLSLPFVLDPAPGRRSGVRFDLTLEPFGAAHRETYTSRRTGLPLVIDEDPDPSNDVLVDLSRRYDTNEWGVRADGDLSIGRSLDVFFGGRVTRVDYVADFDDSVTVDSWDHDEYRADADLYATPDGWLFAAGYTWRRREYRERFPHATDGTEVLAFDPGYEPQRFTYHHVSLKGGVLSDGGRALLRWRATRRIDEYSGYLDYTEHKFSVDLRLEIGRDSELRLEPSWAVRSYDDLRVRYSPDEPVSDRRRFGLEASFEWPAFSRWTHLYLAVDAVSQTSANPLFTYASVRGTTGVRARWR